MKYRLNKRMQQLEMKSSGMYGSSNNEPELRRDSSELAWLKQRHNVSRHFEC